MTKINDRLHYSRRNVRRRQRIVDVGGIDPMSPERTKCPFCSELILQDAIKCRFCGEWLSTPEQEGGTGNPAQGSDYGMDRRKHDHTSFDDSVPVVDAEQPIIPAEPVQNVSREVRKVPESPGGDDGGHADSVQKSQPRVAREVIPGEGLDAGLRIEKRRRRVPWLRALLLILYLGVAGALVVCELRALDMLNAGTIEEAQDPNGAAFDTYKGVLDAYPFSFAVIEARQGLVRICESSGREVPKASWLLRLEDLLGKDATLSDIHYLLPFVVWPVSVLLLLAVLLTRIFRPGIALLSLSLSIVAAAGSLAQFAWYGLVPLAPVKDAAQSFMQTPMAVYCASYLLLVMTGLLTLTGIARPRSS